MLIGQVQRDRERPKDMALRQRGRQARGEKEYDEDNEARYGL